MSEWSRLPSANVLSKLTNERAIRYYHSQEPTDRVKLDEMIADALHLDRRELLSNFTMVWLLAGYPSSDVSHAIGVIEREKGWA